MCKSTKTTGIDNELEYLISTKMSELLVNWLRNCLISKGSLGSCLNWPPLSYPAHYSHLPTIKTARKGWPIYDLGWPFYEFLRYLAREYPILHQNDPSLHLSHQPPLYLSIKFFVLKLVLIVRTYELKSQATCTK